MTEQKIIACYQLRSADEVLALLAAIPEKTSLHIKSQLLNDVIAQVKQEWAKYE